MKYSERRSYAFLALAWKENDSKEWSSFLVLRVKLQNREPEKERKRKIFLRGLSVGESQCKHNRQLFLDSYRGTKFSTGAEIHEEKMCELLNAVPKFYTREKKNEIFLIFATRSTDPFFSLQFT